MNAVVITVIALAVVAALVTGSVVYFRKRETDPELLQLRREVKETSAVLKTAVSRRDKEIAMVRRELKRAEKTRNQAIRSAEQAIKELNDPKGKQLSSYQGVKLYQLWLTTPHGSGSLVGVNASVDSQVSSRITATRLVAIGIFALAAKKKTGALYLSIDGPEFASVIECPQDDQLKAREFATKIANASKSAARFIEERPRRLEEATSALDLARDTSAVEHQRDRLRRVEADPHLLATIENAQILVDDARSRQAAAGTSASAGSPDPFLDQPLRAPKVELSKPPLDRAD